MAAAYAIRCVIARVLPVPAPASTQTGPRVARATSRCSGSSPVSSVSAATSVTAPSSGRSPLGNATGLAGVTRSGNFTNLEEAAGVRPADYVHHSMVRLLPEPEEAARPGRDRDDRGRHRTGPGRGRVRDVGQRRQPDRTDRRAPGRYHPGQPVGDTGPRAVGRGHRGVGEPNGPLVRARRTGLTWTCRRRTPRARTRPRTEWALTRWSCAGPGRAGRSGRRRPPT